MLSKVIIAVLLAASVVVTVVGAVKLRHFCQAVEAHHRVTGNAGSGAFIIAIVCLVAAVTLIWSPWQTDGQSK